MCSNIAIAVQNVTKSYKIFERPQDHLKQTFSFKKRGYHHEYAALKDISFEVPTGQTVGIVGRNGSGKSTLLQIVAGTLRPTSGEVTVNGRIAALLELGSGFNPDFSGRENVYLNASLLGLNRRQIDHLFDDIVQFADIEGFIDQPVKTYSSGMVVRLAFAVQALVPKEILIVDEALAVGDELFQRKCFAKIEEFKQQGGTILFVSHSGSTVVELCDWAIFMDAGEILMTGPSKTVVNMYQKYAFAPNEKRELLRTELASLSKGPKFTSDVSDPERPSANREVFQPMYDPGLIPKNIIRYETRGTRIFGAEITTLAGQKVNMLLSKQRYVWRYYVEFSRACSNVRFGMLIKTATGLEIGGANSHWVAQGIPHVDAGTTLKVEFTFGPSLNPGTYFMNAGVLGPQEEGEVYLDRAIDLAAFRIIADDRNLSTAIVDFDVVSEVVGVNMERDYSIASSQEGAGDTNVR